MLALVVCFVAPCPDVLAQCAMCRTGVSNSGAQAMNLAILVLLIPPVAMFCSVFAIAYRYRNARKAEGATTDGVRHSGQQ